jgi:hypothetical protein
MERPCATAKSLDDVTLAEQFDGNEVTALAYCKDRVAQTGRVACKVSQDILGSYYVALTPAETMPASQACSATCPDPTPSPL